MKKLILGGVLAAVGFVSPLVMAASKPKRLATDSHIKMVNYDPNNVVLLNGRYGYQTQVTFAPNEVIQNVSLGDSMAWQAVPVSNNLFIKPVASSKTNMTVLTNLNSYNFQLDSESQTTEPTYKLNFVYQGGKGASFAGGSAPVGTFDPEKLNWKYTYTGDPELAPTAAFDNNQFTYFKFDEEGDSRLPSVFIVDQNRKESLVNFHMQGNYMVVNAVAKEFTFRDGDRVTTVYNDDAIGDWDSI